MPDNRRVTCRRCDRHKDECGPISWTGNCADCAKAAVGSNLEGLMTHSGPALEAWRRGMAASVGAVLIEDAA